MIRNFFTTALRNILKYKAYSFINFIGLTCGLTLALLIIAYVRHEFKYDQFQEKLDRLYRLSYTAPNGLQLATSPPPIAPAMKDFFPEVEESARVFIRNVSIATENQDQVFEETNVMFADSSLAHMFSFDVMQGDVNSALSNKFTVIITAEMAKKYFGDNDPVGKSLIFSGKHQFKVAAVVKNYPEHSHIQFNMIVPYENMYDMESEQSAKILRQNLAVNFIISHSYTYVLLKKGAQPNGVNANMESFLKKHANPQFLVGQRFSLMPVADIHLKSTLLAEPSTPSSLSNVYIFIGIGILTLLMASINYVNLSTAQSFTRIKEIGVRKILGSMKHQLIVQFIAESFVFCLVAMGLSFLLFYMALPILNALTSKNLVFGEVIDYSLIAAAAVLLLLITVLAGGYPAYFITNFNSINALKGSGISQYGSQWLRKGLVIFQLAIACMLLTGSLLIVKQLKYLEERPLGFQKEHIISIPLFSQNLNGIFRQNDSTYRMRLQTYRDAIERFPLVSSSTLSSNAPGLGAIYRGTLPEGFPEGQTVFIANMAVDFDFLDTYGIELVEGRNFSKEFGTDATEAFIINETAVKEFNWNDPRLALGKTINREGKIGRVIGVIKDFNFASLTTPVSAMVLEVNPNQFNALSIKFSNENVHDILKQLESQWNSFFPEKTFEFNFLDEQLDQQYSNFQNFGKVIQAFTLISIIICCLGVYGLVLFVVQRKVKEIGVRKVLGANLGSILNLIYKDFVLLLLIGFVIAIPCSYYFLDQWLSNFTYRTNIDLVTYGISLLIVFIIVAATISYQALKASFANPVHSLRSE